MIDNKELLREIPQVEKLLNIETIKEYIPVIGHGFVVEIIRRIIDHFKRKITSGELDSIHNLIPSIIKSCSFKKLQKLQHVINGTGVINHTNIGRSPIGKGIFKSLEGSLSGYCNLEIQLSTGRRGKRGRFTEQLICHLTSSEDAIIVNNNAAAVFLILNEFAKGKDVIVSRGELIQIGGGFRIPDIMEQSGARLVEVGTTNITEFNDFENAVCEKTSMIFSAHQSNYSIEGFSKIPSLKELSKLKSSSILLVRDLGSGNLIKDHSLPSPFEPTIESEISQGADLVCFSGDKLLGSGQAGIIIGKKDLISKLRKNPVMRMIRVDKISYYMLQETLLLYENREIEKIPLWDFIYQNKKVLSNKVNRLLRNIKSSRKKEFIRKIKVKSRIGGGSLPALELDSYGIEIDIPGEGPDALYSKFIQSEVPVIGLISNDKFVIDIISVFDDDIPLIASTIDRIMGK